MATRYSNICVSASIISSTLTFISVLESLTFSYCTFPNMTKPPAMDLKFSM